MIRAGLVRPARPPAQETIMKLRTLCLALASLACAALAACDPKPQPPKAQQALPAEVVAHVLQ